MNLFRKKHGSITLTFLENRNRPTNGPTFQTTNQQSDMRTHMKVALPTMILINSTFCKSTNIHVNTYF